MLRSRKRLDVSIWRATNNEGKMCFKPSLDLSGIFTPELVVPILISFHFLVNSSWQTRSSFWLILPDKHVYFLLDKLGRKLWKDFETFHFYSLLWLTERHNLITITSHCKLTDKQPATSVQKTPPFIAAGLNKQSIFTFFVILPFF